MSVQLFVYEAEIARLSGELVNAEPLSELKALLMLRGIHIAKQDETIADLRAELVSTLAKLGEATRVGTTKQVTLSSRGGRTA